MLAPVGDCFYNFIDNQFTEPSGFEHFRRSNPARHEEVITEGRFASTKDIRLAEASARNALPRWSMRPAKSRAEIVGRAIDSLEAQTEYLAYWVTRENGKPIHEARAECIRAIDSARQNISFFNEHSGATSRQLGGVHGLLMYEPLGTALLITPWNYPVATILRKLIPALLCGNSVILKPSELTPVSAQIICSAFLAAELEPGVLSLLAGGSAVGRSLIENRNFEALSFTGSTTVGLAIAQATGGSQIRTQLEMGGKNPLVVHEDASLEQAVEALLVGGLTCSGQWCVGTSRVLVHENVYKRFLDLSLASLAKVQVGDGFDASTTMGPLISEQQFDKVSGFLTRAVADGSEVQAGGPDVADSQQGWFVGPTLITNTPLDSPLWNEEVFGPVLAMRSYDTLDEAIALSNDSKYGLTASIFTESHSVASKFISEVDYGRVSVNTSTGVTHALLPHGGRRESGRGEPENGLHGLRFFSQHKSAYVANLNIDSVLGGID